MALSTALSQPDTAPDGWNGPLGPQPGRLPDRSTAQP